MAFPITELLDEDACFAKLVEWLHPDGFACPRCHKGDLLAVHRRRRPPVLDFRCGHCRRVFNAFIDTARHSVKRRTSELVLIVILSGSTRARAAKKVIAIWTWKVDQVETFSTSAGVRRRVRPFSRTGESQVFTTRSSGSDAPSGATRIVMR
jgi:transposase-like protein